MSLFYFSAYAASLVMILNLHRFMNKFGRSTIFFVFYFLQICFVAFLTLVEPSISGAIILVCYIISMTLSWASLDVIVESYSEDKKSGRIRGLHLTIMNIGIFLGPFVSTRILTHYDFKGLFFAAMLVHMGIFLFMLVKLRRINNSKFEQKITVRDLFKKILVNRNVMKIYSIALLLDFFYALTVIYVPLFLLDNGFSWDRIGIIFTIMLIPFIILQYPLGLLADKKYGEKEMLIMGIIIMGISSACIFFITSKEIWVWGTILFITRIGAAIIEIMRDSYFYKKIDARDVDIIGFFRTAGSVGYILAAATSAVLLLVLPMKYVFLLLAGVVLCGLYPAIKLVDNKCEAEMKKRTKKISYGLSN
ncbi:MAG: MFS transporter [Candidatus Moranbacteria bacterium]|nr:MFS transporter [Candidatus Moranbacteria bacterium]